MSPALPRERAAARHVRHIVDRSGSSFRWPMRLLPRRRREGMFAVYALARVLDDIADGDAPAAAKQRELERWRDEIGATFAGAPRTRVGVALAPAIAAFGLERRWVDDLIDGMATDAAGPVFAPSLAELDLYCHRVAGAVGRLSVAIFGRRDSAAQEFADALGRALQLTNILRDLDEDAGLGRLYLPRELLDEAGVPAVLGTPAAVLRHPGLPLACARLIERAETAYTAAIAAADRGGRQRLTAGLRMTALYRLRLEALKRRGFERLDPVRVRRRDKLRALLLPGQIA
jgi:phytoene synthase